MEFETLLVIEMTPNDKKSEFELALVKRGWKKTDGMKSVWTKNIPETPSKELKTLVVDPEKAIKEDLQYAMAETMMKTSDFTAAFTAGLGKVRYL